MADQNWNPGGQHGAPNHPPPPQPQLQPIFPNVDTNIEELQQTFNARYEVFIAQMTQISVSALTNLRVTCDEQLTQLRTELVQARERIWELEDQKETERTERETAEKANDAKIEELMKQLESKDRELENARGQAQQEADNAQNQLDQMNSRRLRELQDLETRYIGNLRRILQNERMVHRQQIENIRKEHEEQKIQAMAQARAARGREAFDRNTRHQGEIEALQERYEGVISQLEQQRDIAVGRVEELEEQVSLQAQETGRVLNDMRSRYVKENQQLQNLMDRTTKTLQTRIHRDKTARRRFKRVVRDCRRRDRAAQNIQRRRDRQRAQAAIVTLHNARNTELANLREQLNAANLAKQKAEDDQNAQRTTDREEIARLSDLLKNERAKRSAAQEARQRILQDLKDLQQSENRYSVLFYAAEDELEQLRRRASRELGRIIQENDDISHKFATLNGDYETEIERVRCEAERQVKEIEQREQAKDKELAQLRARLDNNPLEDDGAERGQDPTEDLQVQLQQARQEIKDLRAQAVETARRNEQVAVETFVKQLKDAGIDVSSFHDRLRTANQLHPAHGQEAEPKAHQDVHEQDFHYSEVHFDDQNHQDDQDQRNEAWRDSLDLAEQLRYNYDDQDEQDPQEGPSTRPPTICRNPRTGRFSRNRQNHSIPTSTSRSGRGRGRRFLEPSDSFEAPEIAQDLRTPGPLPPAPVSPSIAERIRGRSKSSDEAPVAKKRRLEDQAPAPIPPPPADRPERPMTREEADEYANTPEVKEHVGWLYNRRHMLYDPKNKDFPQRVNRIPYASRLADWEYKSYKYKYKRMTNPDLTRLAKERKEKLEHMQQQQFRLGIIEKSEEFKQKQYRSSGSGKKNNWCLKRRRNCDRRPPKAKKELKSEKSEEVQEPEEDYIEHEDNIEDAEDKDHHDDNDFGATGAAVVV